MSTLKDWTCKGFDLTFDGSREWSQKEKVKIVYPYGIEHKFRFAKSALSVRGTNKRISIVDKAISKASKV